MTDSIYAPPEAEITAPPGGGPRYYVVGMKKFLLLSTFTFGLYTYYWTYKNWRYIKEEEANDSWPIARGFFAIFWMHSLLADVDGHLITKQKDYTWSPGIIATIFVVLTIISNGADRVLDRFYDYVTSFPPISVHIAVFAMPVIVAFVMRPAQRAINVACDDDEGTSNARLTAANWLWLVLGSIFWLGAIFGLYAIYYMGI